MIKLSIKNLIFRQRLRVYAHSASVAVPAFLLLCALAGGSCTKAIDDAPGGSAGRGTHDVTITLSPRLANAIDVKAGTSVDDAPELENLAIFQFNEDDGRILCNPQLITNLQKDNGVYRCQAALMKGKCKVVFIANYDLNSQLVNEIKEFKALSEKRLTIAVRENTFDSPFTAEWTGEVNRETEIAAKLKSSTADLKLTIDTREVPNYYTVILQSIVLQTNGEALFFPTPGHEADNLSTRIITMQKVEQPLDITNQIISFDIPVVPWPGGVGTATSPKEKDKNHTPASGYNTNVVTIVFLLKEKDGGFDRSEIVKIYLGQNAINDFNVYANDKITATLKIKGFQLNDTRISTSANAADQYIDYPLRWSKRKDDPITAVDNLEEQMLTFIWDGRVAGISKPDHAVELNGTTHATGVPNPFMTEQGWIIQPRISVNANGAYFVPKVYSADTPAFFTSDKTFDELKKGPITQDEITMLRDMWSDDLWERCEKGKTYTIIGELFKSGVVNPNFLLASGVFLDRQDYKVANSLQWWNDHWANTMLENSTKPQIAVTLTECEVTGEVGGPTGYYFNWWKMTRMTPTSKTVTKYKKINR